MIFQLVRPLEYQYVSMLLNSISIYLRKWDKIIYYDIGSKMDNLDKNFLICIDK